MIQCASCHGFDRQGDHSANLPSLIDLGTRRTPDSLHQLLINGTGGRMPSFAQMPEGQRRALVDFLYGQEKAAEAYATPGRGAGAGQANLRQPYVFRGFQQWADHEGYPAISPPWGTLNAVDMNTGELKWKVTLGEFPALTKRGIPPTGAMNYGGPVVTASGLLFIAATTDETIRAFDKDTGKLLWQAKLPFSGNSTPSVYSVNGKQYLIVSAGGHRSVVGRPFGGSIVAFTLP
jgi:quinoprotein glucose dehydrogenase